MCCSFAFFCTSNVVRWSACGHSIDTMPELPNSRPRLTTAAARSEGDGAKFTEKYRLCEGKHQQYIITSESDPRSYEATKTVAKKARWSLRIFLGLPCNCFSCFIFSCIHAFLKLGNFREDSISRFLKGDILRHLIFVILENLFLPSHLIFRDFLLSRR